MSSTKKGIGRIVDSPVSPAYPLRPQGRAKSIVSEFVISQEREHRPHKRPQAVLSRKPHGFPPSNLAPVLLGQLGILAGERFGTHDSGGIPSIGWANRAGLVVEFPRGWLWARASAGAKLVPVAAAAGFGLLTQGVTAAGCGVGAHGGQNGMSSGSGVGRSGPCQAVGGWAGPFGRVSVLDVGVGTSARHRRFAA